MGELSPLDILIWFLVLLVIIAFLMMLAVRYWKAQTQGILRQISTDSRRLKTNSSSMRQAIQGFDPGDPEPFGSLATSYNQQLDQADAHIRDVQKQYAFLQDQVRQTNGSEVVTLLRLPINWYHLQRQAGELWKQHDETVASLEAAEKISSRLEKLGWEVATQVQQTLRSDKEAIEIMDKVRAARIQDPVLQSSQREGKEWESALTERIPLYFLTSEQNVVLEKADKDSIVQAHQLLCDARPAVEQLLAKAKTWQGQVTALDAATAELKKAFEPLEKKLSALEAHAAHPVILDGTRKSLHTLKNQIDTLAGTGQPRSLDQLAKDLSGARRLTSQVEELSNRIEDLEEKHQELVGLASNPDLRGGTDFAKSAAKLTQQVEGYHPDNWDKADAVGDLRGEVKALIEHQQRLIQPQSSVAEADLPQALEDARRLAVLHQSLRPRVNGIQKRLGELQSAEKDAREALAKARVATNQAASLAAANPLLSERATNEVQQVRESMEDLVGQLDQHDQGNVEMKAQRAAALTKKIEGLVNDWLDVVNTDLAEKKAVLAGQLNSLFEIALVEDGPVVEAQRLVAGSEGEQQIPLPAAGSKKEVKKSGFNLGRILPRSKGETRSHPALPAEEAIAQLKASNDEWHLCVATTHALEDIAGPVLSRYDKVLEARQSAVDTLNKALELMPEDQSWPATTQSLGGEHSEWERLESQLTGLQQEQVLALRLVSRLSDLSDGYSRLASRVGQLAEKASQEQSKITDAERHLNETKRLWLEQARLHNDSPLARGEVQALLDEADQELDNIRQRYHRRTINYNQALQSVRVLSQKLDSAEVPVSPELMMDINGDTHRR